MNDIQIFDNFITSKAASRLENTLLNNPYFPWYYVKNITSDYNEPCIFKIKDHAHKPALGFGHSIFNKRDITHSKSSYHYVFDSVLDAIEEKITPIEELLRIRLGFNLPNNSGSEEINQPHFDFFEPHYTLCYYINETEGDTVLYDEMYNDKVQKDMDLGNMREVNIVERIKPKKNRAVIFSGFRLHSSSTSSNNIRVVATINFI